MNQNSIMTVDFIEEHKPMVAAVSGDARRALEICRRAAELTDYRVKNSISIPKSGKTLVGMAEVEVAIWEMFQQAGGEFADLIIVLRSEEAVKTFSGDVHVSFGAGLSAAVGITGRTAEANVRAGTGGYAARYTYSCIKGAFVGCSLEGSVVTTRTNENSRFYGKQSITAPEILLGSLPKPPAAATLYRALSDIYQKLGTK